MTFESLFQRAQQHGLVLQRSIESKTHWTSGYVLTMPDGSQKRFSTLGEVDRYLWMYFDSRKEKVQP